MTDNDSNVRFEVGRQGFESFAKRFITEQLITRAAGLLEQGLSFCQLALDTGGRRGMFGALAPDIPQMAFQGDIGPRGATGGAAGRAGAFFGGPAQTPVAAPMAAHHSHCQAGPEGRSS